MKTNLSGQLRMIGWRRSFQSCRARSTLARCRSVAIRPLFICQVRFVQRPVDRGKLDRDAMGLQQRVGQFLQGDVWLRADDLNQKSDVRGQLARRAGNPTLQFGCKTAGLVLACNQTNDRARPNPEHTPRSTTRMTRFNITSHPNSKIKR